MANEGLDDDEEWGDDLLAQLLQAEALALSAVQRPHHQPPLPPPPLFEGSYSPPRELSQHLAGGIPDRFDSFAPPEADSFTEKQELERLKKELSRLSKQLDVREQECLELRNERDKKEEELKLIHSTNGAKVNAELPTAPGLSTVNASPSNKQRGSSPSNKQHGSSPSNKQRGSLTKSWTAVGVQTDETTEIRTPAVGNVISRSKKLHDLWNSDDQKLGKDLVRKLFEICEADFRELFPYLRSPQADSTQPIEAEKVSHLYSVLSKISNDTARLKDLLEALADLCRLKNVAVIYRSLRVLHMTLSNSLSMENKFGKRENVIVEYSESDIRGSEDSEKESLNFSNVAEMLKKSQISGGVNIPAVKTPGRTGFFDRSSGASISVAYCISLFEHMCLVAIENNEEQIRFEALSIMNLILMRQNAYSERDKFAGEIVVRSLPQLLRKEAGFSAQDQAVHTLYLLCNCPKVIHMLCSGFKEDEQHAPSVETDDLSILSFRGMHEILISLSYCVAFCGTATAEEMKLRKSAITFLAFLASSGKSGFELLLINTLPNGANFLTIIVTSISSDLDLQEAKPAKQSGLLTEQCLVIREALIVLNRLMSHAQYSLPVLQALTSTREMASTTVEVANRLSQKNKSKLFQKHIRESKITDLAQVFKKRIFAFLGDCVS